MPEGTPDTKEFELPVVLSVTTGMLVIPPEEFYKVVDLMSYVKQETLVRPDQNADGRKVMEMLHKAALQCTPWIFSQFPSLSGYTPPKKGWREWLKGAEKEVGERLALKPLPLSEIGWTPSKEEWAVLSQPAQVRERGK